MDQNEPDHAYGNERIISSQQGTEDRNAFDIPREQLLSRIDTIRARFVFKRSAYDAGLLYF